MEQYIPQPGDLIPMLPGAIAGAAVLLLAAWFYRKNAVILAVLCSGLALAAGHFITYSQVQGLPGFPPHQSTERMVFAVVVVALGSILTRFHSRRILLKWSIRLGLFIGLVTYLLFPLLRLAPADPSHLPWTTVLFLATVGVVFWIFLENLSLRFQSPALPLALSLLMGLYGQILVMYGAAKLAQLSGTAALVLGASAVVCRWLPGSRLPRTTVGVFMAVLAGIGLDGYYFISETPPLLSLTLPLATIPLMFLFLVKPFNRIRKAPRFALQMAVAAVPFLIAFWIALAPVLEREPNPYDSLY